METSQTSLRGAGRSLREACLQRSAANVSRNPDDAEDVTQETFLSALENRNGFSGEFRFHTWLMTITLYKGDEPYELPLEFRSRLHGDLRTRWKEIHAGKKLLTIAITTKSSMRVKPLRVA